MTKGEIQARNHGLVIGMTMGLTVVKNVEVAKNDIIRIAVAEQSPAETGGIFIEPPLTLGAAEQSPAETGGIFIEPVVSIGVTTLLEGAQ